MTNIVPRQYREVSVTTVDFELSADRISEHLRGREVYRRTRYAVLRHGDETAVAAVDKPDEAGGRDVMTVVTGVSLLALPGDCRFVVAPDADTAIPSSLATVARQAAPGVRAVVVEGRYHHINFILDPAPLVVRVVDVVPPAPPKLLDQAARLLEVAEDLPPLELRGDVVDLADLSRAHPADRYLLPCRGSGFAPDGDVDVDFLDERPPRQEWTLIGCSRSRELHQWFYGDLPETVEMCPRILAGADREGTVTLTKCCLLESGIEVDGDTVVVPWGASLEQVGQGLRAAARLAAPAEKVEATWSPA